MARTIVLAIDPASSLSRPVTEWTMKNIVRDNDLLHIITGWSLDPQFDALDYAGDYIYMGAMLSEQEEETSEKYMAVLEALSIISKRISDKVQIQASLLRGKVSAGDQIVEFCEMNKADMLVVGSRDLSALKRFWSGSFSDFCAHHVKCPVTIVKHADEFVDKTE